jgi:predicted TIM-barrel fold metal-dependent hydrolase
VIVDAHVHISADGWIPSVVEDSFRPLYARLVRESDRTPEQLEEDAASGDPHGDRLISDLDAGGIDGAVLLGIDMGPDVGDPVFPLAAQHEMIRTAAARHPGRLVWLLSTDPRRAEAVDLLEQAIADGARGLGELYPPGGFSPADMACEPLYEVLVSHDLPVVTHCGPAAPALRSRFAHPIEWDDVAARHPNLQIVLGHGGKLEAWAREAIGIAIQNPSIHFDLSLWDGWVTNDELTQLLRFMRERLGPDRIMWASDRYGVAGERDRVAAWRVLVQELATDAGFPAEDVDLLLGGNAERLFRIQSRP